MILSNKFTDTKDTEWIHWIEEAIAKKHIKFYEYEHFNNIEEIVQRVWKSIPCKLEKFGTTFCIEIFC